MSKKVGEEDEDEEEEDEKEDDDTEANYQNEKAVNGGRHLGDDEVRDRLRKASEELREKLNGNPPPIPSGTPMTTTPPEDEQPKGKEETKEQVSIKSPDEEMMDEVYNELIDGLPKISGADRVKVQFAIDLIKDNPSVMLDPANLYLHIKQTVPRVNDYLLHTLIDSIFSKINAESPAPAYPFASDMRRPSYTPQSYAPRYQGYGGYGGYGMYGSGYGSGGMGPYQNPNSVLDQQAMLERLEQMREKHELEMEELKQRIIAQSQQKDQTVKINLNGQPVEVPASLVPFLMMNQKKEEDKIPIDFNGKTIEVPASLAPLYLALSKPKEDDEVKKLEEKLDELQRQAQQQQNQQLMERIAQLQDEIASLKEQPNIMDQIRAVDQMAQSLGYKKSGTTIVDLLTNAEHDVHQVASTVATKIQPPNFQPEIKRTPEERKELAQKMAKGAEAGGELAEAEDALLEALKG